MAASLFNPSTWFRPRPEQQQPQQIAQSRMLEAAWGERLLAMRDSIPKYNPDDLISRKRFDIYDRMMIDEQVKAVVRFKRDAITSRDFFFEFPDETDLSDDEQDFRKRLFLHFTRCQRGSFLDTLNFIMTSMYQGFSMTEKVFDFVSYEGKTYVGPKKMALKPHESFFFYVDDFGEILKVEQHVNGARQDVDKDKFIHHVQNPEVDQHYGRSELREAYRDFFNKDYAHQLLSIFLERHASGFIWASPKDEGQLRPGTDEYANMQTILKNVQASTSLIVPNGIELNYESPATTDQFERAISLYNLGMAKSLLVPNLLGITETGPYGSRALGEEHVETFLWTLDADTARLEETMNEQLFRELGDINFGDGRYPFFKFKPISDRAKMELISKWNEMVTGGSVRPTTADENHVRGLLDFPIKDEEDQDENAEPTDPGSALTGVQIKSLMEILDGVAHEKLPRETGIQLIVRSFPFNLEQAESIMGEIGKGFKPPAPPPQLAPGGPGQPVGGPAKPGEPAVPGEGDLEEGDPNAGGDPPANEKVEASARVSRAAFSRASRRVDFAVIDRKERNLVADDVDELAAHMDKMIAELVGSFQADGFASDPAELRKQVTPNSQNVTKLKKILVASMRDGWGIGLRHAKDELGKTKFTASQELDFVRIDDIAGKFFQAKAFTVTGKLTEDMINVMQNSVLQGIKGSKATEQIIIDIYSQLATAGMVSEEAATAAVGSALQVENPAHRLRTIIRTNANEAINEARYSTFTDPSLGGFVEALEYSATLDDAVSEICEHLDGRIYPANSPEWDVYRPPNHFNCRSTLIAVTTEDTWTEAKPPTVDPQQGFS